MIQLRKILRANFYAVMACFLTSLISACGNFSDQLSSKTTENCQAFTSPTTIKYYEQKKGVKLTMNFAKPHHVNDLLILRENSKQTLLETLEPTSEQIFENVSYEKLENITRIYNPSKYPAHFYVKGDQIVMIYLNNPDFLSNLTPETITDELCGEGEHLTSRIDKSANHYVYAQEGFAYSEEDDQVIFIEVFSPMSFEEYENLIYQDQGAYIR